MTKAPTPTEMSKGQSDNTNSTTKKKTQKCQKGKVTTQTTPQKSSIKQLRTVSWSNYSHPTGIDMKVEYGSYEKKIYSMQYFNWCCSSFLNVPKFSTSHNNRWIDRTQYTFVNFPLFNVSPCHCIPYLSFTDLGVKEMSKLISDACTDNRLCRWSQSCRHHALYDCDDAALPVHYSVLLKLCEDSIDRSWIDS